MIYTEFLDRRASTKVERDVAFDDFCNQIDSAEPVATKEALPLVKLARFGDIANDNSCLRTNENMLSSSGVIVDYDDGVLSLDEAADMFEAASIAAYLHSTASATLAEHKWHAVLPFSAELPPEQHDVFVRRVNGALGGVISDESFSRSQSYYTGKVIGRPFHSRRVAGRCINDVPGLPEIGRRGPGGVGPSGYTREHALDDIACGVNLHCAINYLAMSGASKADIEAAMMESSARTEDPTRWAKRLADVDRSVRGAERRRAKERDKALKSMPIPPPPPEAFQVFTAASLHGKPVPPQRWLVRDMIPAGQPVLLSGDGGLGKSLLGAQLSVAVATGGSWLGMFTAQGPALYLSAEDETAEIHRRLFKIAPALDKLTELHIAPMAELDPLLVAPSGGALSVTPLFNAVAAKVREIRPALVVLDSNADFYGGNEVVRSEVRWFIARLRQLCHETGCTVLLLSHPSVSGMQSGSGLSGSTHWNNSVRARLYLTRPTGDNPDPDVRVLEILKNNRGSIGKRVEMRWTGGAFVALDGGDATATTPADADEFFVSMLATYNRRKMNVTTSTGATYAPSVFAKEDAAKARGITRKMLAAAMGRLLDANQILNVAHRTGSDARYHLEVAAEGLPRRTETVVEGGMLSP